MTTRILITGSRHWANTDMVRNALAAAITTHPGPFTIVHGGAHGADELAATLAPTLGPHVSCERWNADWNGPCRAECKPLHRRRHTTGDYCPAAGTYRNADMVAAGADLCLAFPLGTAFPDSRGTRDCMRRAADAGIPVIDVPATTCAPLFNGRSSAARRAWSIANRTGTEALPPVWCPRCDGWHLTAADMSSLGATT